MRVAIVGCGEMGSAHAAAYAGFGRKEGVEIAGVVSRTRARARALGTKLKVPWHTDVRDVLPDDSVDAVDVAVPSGAHRRFVVDALRHGKHAFVETPIALTLRDADAMIAAAKENRRRLLVAQVMRFVADYRYAREESHSGRLGAPRHVVARRLARPYWSRKKPRPFSAYGEPLFELAIHDFDVANWILGAPRSVFASGVVGPRGSPQHFFAGIEYPHGQALVEGSAMMPSGFPFTTALRVACEAGVLDHTTQFLGGRDPTIRHVRYSQAGVEPVRIRGQDPYLEECRHFVRSVQRKADPRVLSPEADRDALRVALAARESIRTGRRVAVP